MSVSSQLIEKIPVVVLLLLSASSVVAGDYFAKLWSINPSRLLFGLAVLGYIGSAVFYIPTLLREGLVITSVVWTILSIVGFLVVGVLIFNEALTGWQIAGVTIGVIALIILSFS